MTLLAAVALLGCGDEPPTPTPPPEDCSNVAADDFDGGTDCADPDCVATCDADGDGAIGVALGGTDCDDADPAVRPGAPESCNGRDDDCDGLADDADPDAVSASTFHEDADGDGYGDPAVSVTACVAPDGYVEDATDCAPTDPAIHDLPWRPDADGDGWGAYVVPAYGCVAPPGYVDVGGDCDDHDPLLNPDTPWYADRDGDGFGDPLRDLTACDQPDEGWVRDGTDCDDDDPDLHPGALRFTDADGDGYGDPAAADDGCDTSATTPQWATDCDDGAPLVFPLAPELCDGLDNDCDGAPEVAPDVVTWYADADGDGAGDPGSAVEDCAAPVGYVTNALDCADGDPSITRRTLSERPAVGGGLLDSINDVEAADLDGDGDLDLVQASVLDDTVSWFENLGGGVFGPETVASVTVDAPLSVVVADLDGDGDGDLVATAADGDEVVALENDGAAGGWLRSTVGEIDGPTGLVATDLDGDGDADVAAASDALTGPEEVAVYLNTGGGFDLPVVLGAGGKPVAIAAGDLDGDGDADLVVALFDYGALVQCENLGAGVFGPPRLIDRTFEGAVAIRAVDLDGDGDIDLTGVASDDRVVSAWENLGGGTFGDEIVLWSTWTDPSGLDAGDLDGDGDPDLAVNVLGGDGQVLWLENRWPRWVKHDVVDVPVFGGSDALVADLDGDGLNDLAVTMDVDDEIRWFASVCE